MSKIAPSEIRYTEQRRYPAHMPIGNTYVLNEKLRCKGLGKQGTLKQGLSSKTVVKRLKPKNIYLCEGRGMTDESSVTEVEEQPQV